VAWHSLSLGNADNHFWEGDSSESEFSLASFEPREGSLHFDVPGGCDWALFFFALTTSTESRPSLDYSIYDTLVLEMEGDVGGERILLNLKDREDSDDGTQTNVELLLTDEWKTFTIDLAAFKTADLKELHSVLSLLFEGTAPSFSIRTARYEKRP
jgi:hypothetical protein